MLELRVDKITTRKNNVQVALIFFLQMGLLLGLAVCPLGVLQCQRMQLKVLNNVAYGKVS